jgi:hypothetical protein
MVGSAMPPAMPDHPTLRKYELGLRRCPARTAAAYYEEASMPTTNATNSVFPSLVPTEVRALFGDPPLLRGEEPSLYNNLMDQFSRLVEPKDMIEWWWVKDITDHTWEIRRLRRFKVLFVELRRDKVVDNREHWNTLGENVKYVPVPVPDGEEETGGVWVQENPDYKPVAVPDSEKDSAEFFMATVNEYKSADRLIAAAEVRRDRTLREIERRREHLARRVREASDKIIDDEAAEVARAAA